MSVIIRLQNLPWSANAADIRQYFQGLSIPEGGVHIVGGEKGDVFISFSTDEDARQAMLSDGGCIKDVQIRLLLSSRNEMQKVIDSARQQTIYNAYMQQNMMQQPQIPIVGSLPPLTAKVLPQPQQQVRQVPQMLHRPTLIDNISVLMPQDKQQMQNMQQQVLSPKSLENRDRDDKSHKRSDRSRSKSRERRSKSSRSGGSRRDRSRSRDRRRRDRSRGRDRSRDRYRGGDGRSSTSRGSGGKSQMSRSPIANKATDGTLPATQQSQINPWNCQYDNLQQQQGMVENHQPAATMMNNVMPGSLGGFPQFRTPPQPPIIPVILPQNSSFHQQQPPQQQQQQQQQQLPSLMNNLWGSSGGNRSNQQQPPYVPDNDFRAGVYGGGGSDDEDDRQAEFDNNFHGKYNDNSAPGMRRGPPGQDFREHRGFGSNRGGPRFHKPQQVVPPVVGQHNRGGVGGQRPFDEFGNGGGHRFNHQQQLQPPRFGGHNIPDGGGGRGRPSKFSSINENGIPSRFNQISPLQQQQQQPHRDNDEGRSAEFDEPCKRMPPRYNDRYRYDVRNAQIPHADGLCVEVNNMSNPFSYGDIRKLFEGIHIDGSAIKIQKHRQGVAFVRFDNNNNKNLALKINGTAYKGNNVVVKHLDDEAYERDNTDDRPYPKATASSVSNIVDHVDLVDGDDDDETVSSDKKKSNKSKTDDGVEGSDNDNDLVVCEKITNKDGAASVEGGGDEPPRKDSPTKYLKLKQLPVTVTEEDVMNEFDGGTDVRRVIFYPDGEFMGAALEFTSTEVAESALKRHDCVLLGSTPVPVLRCTYKEYSQIRRKSGGDDGGGGGGDNNSNSSSSRHHNHSSSHHHHPHSGSTNHHRHSPVPVAPPPPNVSGAVPGNRSNCLYVYGLPTNVTNTDITQFFSDATLPDKIHIMLSKFGRPTGESYCEFGTSQQANTALSKNQCYMGQNVVCIEPINRSLMIQAITKPMQPHCNNQDMSWGGAPSRHQQHHQRPPQSQQYGVGPYGGRPQHQQFNMNNGGARGGGGYTPRIRGPGPGPNTGPDGFGQPGCVVALDNVPYRADVQQIVEFFEGFELHSQNVIRRFNDFGKPTGEARVNLRNPQDAARAVRVLQNKPIFNRPVRLTLL